MSFVICFVLFVYFAQYARIVNSVSIPEKPWRANVQTALSWTVLLITLFKYCFYYADEERLVASSNFGLKVLDSLSTS